MAASDYPVTNRSYQSLFEKRHFHLKDYRTDENLDPNPTDIRQIKYKCNYSAEEIGRCLFDNIMITGESAVSQVGYSFVCAAEVGSNACLFMGHESGRRTGHHFMHINVTFDFPKSDGVELITPLVHSGATTVRLLSDKTLSKPTSEFAGFLRAVTKKEGIEVWFPDVNNNVSMRYVAVDKGTVRRIEKIIDGWALEAGDRKKRGRIGEWTRLKAIQRASVESIEFQPDDSTATTGFDSRAEFKNFVPKISAHVDKGFGKSEIERVIKIIDADPDSENEALLKFPIVFAGKPANLHIQFWLNRGVWLVNFSGPYDMMRKLDKQLGNRIQSDEDDAAIDAELDRMEKELGLQ